MNLSRRAWMSFLVVSLTAVPAALADGIFDDGFEECGAARWSSGNPAPPAEQLTDLTASGLAAAMGACAPSLQAAQFVLADGSAPNSTALDQMSDQQSAIFQSFGTGGMVPTAGGAMIALSSGTARAFGQSGYAAPEPGTNYGRSTTGPSAFMSAHGGTFPGLPGCGNGPNTLNDSVGLRLTFTVPLTADRLAFDWRYLTADYPEWVCSAFIDYFLGVVVTGSSPSLPVDRNVVLDSVSRPISVDSPDIDVCTGCSSGDGALAGTGYPANDSAATEWRTAYVPVVGGETLVLDLLAFDVGDGATDNLVLLDGLRWISD